jgi:hypothetical protein
MKIGLDFDNTIIRYDGVFLAAAKARGLLPPEFLGTKQQVRDAIRLRPGGEIDWQKLQGHVYGAGIGGAELFPGLAHFLGHANAEGAELIIVSHKSEFGHYDPQRINLREAALGWMEGQGFFSAAGFGLERANVHFGATRAEKLDRITELAPDIFIDDLEEVLDDPAFPPAVSRILFSEQKPAHPAYPVYPDWAAIEAAVLS